MLTMKKHLSRRTVLRGMGAAVALPFLEAMAPAFTPVAQTAASPLMRFGVVFVPLGERPELRRALRSRSSFTGRFGIPTRGRRICMPCASSRIGVRRRELNSFR